MAESNDLGLPSLQKLQSAEQMELLDVVDSLRACGLSEIVALPQLIVCGDQSSGKSSVLEAISGLPFPKQDTLCTRFATEVILRRADKVEINVSIVPGDDRAMIDRDRLLRFRRELKTKDDFGGLFKGARDEMGLSSSGKSFSNDTLRVEFCGPSQPQLTLVDLPGLIHSETKTQTAGDVQLVHNLVSRYLENPRSIILAVVSAKNDIGNQIILRNARNFDPQGLRTLGIITKPDLLAKGSKSEESFVTLARNEDVKFSLGWHVVKNLDSAIRRNQQEDTRDEQETLFFQESGFNRLPAHTTGITSLRSRLSKILFSQIRRELPRLVEDIQIQITAERIARDKLGPSRSQPSQQREFLISLSQMFQTICRDAVKGDYDYEFFQGDANPERRLCANVMNMHFDFASNIRKDGASWLIDDENMLSEKYRSRNDAIKEACILLKRSRGRELPGLPNPLLVGELFRQYSRPWGDLARLHIEKVWETTNRFLELLLRHLTDEDVCENIFRFWLHPIMEEKLKLAYSKLDDLLEVHKDYPMTTNSTFINHSKNTRQESGRESLESVLRSRLQSKQDVSVDEITQMMLPITTKPDLDMDMVAAEEALDHMNAYYEIAMNLFTDNVPTLAVQAPIIRAIPETFCPTAVYLMPGTVVHNIAGETEEKTVEREAILRRLATLEKGALICKQYAKRPQQGLNVLSERFVPGPRTLGDEGKNTPGKSPSAPTFFPDSVPKAGSTPNIFGHLSVPSQVGIGSRSEAPSLSNSQQDRTPSPKPKSKTPKPAMFR
ncbi:P-loop containing nucleoside triphosphate hydrolase protein [Leptodontidium sp. MPI-SDFR-AT-0119]|nr:P-loop containing nucleoside triphosphate hydrolase protein [Leptodontidium sp. MPI-SDFR-AT-0119]